MVAAACNGATGVDLEIRSEVPIERVEIFLANRECTDRDQLHDVTRHFAWHEQDVVESGEGTRCASAIEADKDRTRELGHSVVTRHQLEHDLASRCIAHVEIGMSVERPPIIEKEHTESLRADRFALACARTRVHPYRRDTGRQRHHELDHADRLASRGEREQSKEAADHAATIHRGALS